MFGSRAHDPGSGDDATDPGDGGGTDQRNDPQRAEEAGRTLPQLLPDHLVRQVLEYVMPRADALSGGLTGHQQNALGQSGLTAAYTQIATSSSSIASGSSQSAVGTSSQPDSVTTAFHEQALPMTIGVIVVNTLQGSTGNVAGWQAKEIIVFVEDESSAVFNVHNSYTSDWLAADEQRIDMHLLSTSAIKSNLMTRNGDEYHCVFTQVFKRKRTGEDDARAQRIGNSAFEIRHTVKWQNNQWEYRTTKKPIDLGTVAPGNGGADSDWRRVPI
ncbi:hypothetical protein [Streptacidiphilus melanogenes]|uniref:hypothetical protein n=1 Tax=Streptacidiphilus melanogenes TaxID=411235 RepID=UPI0005AA5835|nr:hypothetical protein [Streptacidiphilus melanogenes]